MKSLYGKGVDYFFRNVPTVTKEIGLYRRSWQFLCDILSQSLENRRVLPYHQILSGRTACLCAKKETIYGHFLICYLSLFLLRILEIECFKNEINSYDLVNFMRDFRVVDKGDGTYINISQNQRVNEKIKKLIGLTNLDALYLTEKESENIFEFTMLIDD